MEGRRSTNYWPGFVDALSNMVLAMIFVVLVLALAMGTYAKLAADAIEKRLKVEAAAAATETGGGAIIAELPAAALIPPLPVTPVEAAATAGATAAAGETPPEAEPATAQAPAAKRVRVGADAASAAAQATRLRREREVLVLEFESAAVTLDAAARSALAEALGPLRDSLRTGSILLLARAPGGSLTESRQVSFYRAMAVRNQLVELGVAAARIDLLVPEDDAAVEVGEVRVTLRAGPPAQAR